MIVFSLFLIYLIYKYCIRTNTSIIDRINAPEMVKAATVANCNRFRNFSKFKPNSNDLLLFDHKMKCSDFGDSLTNLVQYTSEPGLKRTTRLVAKNNSDLELNNLQIKSLKNDNLSREISHCVINMKKCICNETESESDDNTTNDVSEKVVLKSIDHTDPINKRHHETKQLASPKSMRRYLIKEYPLYTIIEEPKVVDCKRK